MIRPLALAGAWEISPVLRGTPDRLFLEICRIADIASLGPFEVAQASLSVSTRGAIRGIHYGTYAQKKIVTCTAGEVLDVVVDLRVDSPTFGRWDAVQLDDVTRRAVYIGDGLGHGFCALSERATLLYLVSSVYQSDGEREVHPFDPDLAIAWPTAAPELSERDTTAPLLADAFGSGLLPRMRQP